MAGKRQPANRDKPQGRPEQNPYGAPKGEQGYGSDATYKMKNGQLTIGNKSGARSWLGAPTASQTGDEFIKGDSGVMPTRLVPMGMGKNGFMQHGYVPTGEAGTAGSMAYGGLGTPYAMEGGARAGRIDSRTPEGGWKPIGAANTQAWRGMQSAITGKPSTGGHMEFGQKGQDTGNGMRQNPRGQNSQGGMPNKGLGGGQGPAGSGKPGGAINVDPGFNKGPQLGGGNGGGGRRKNRPPNKGLPNLPPPQAGGGMVGGVGEFPQMPEPPADFLPMTPGYEQDWRGLNDQLGAAEGVYAQGQAMLPAQYNLENTRLQNDQDLATNRLKEDLAGRGVYTAKNAAGGYGGNSPAGGGIGQTMYGRNVATPFGRQRQDLAANAAGAYQDLYGTYANANLGYAQGMNEALLGRADEAYQLDPMGLANSGYTVPDMAQPYYPYAPQTSPTGRTRPKKNNNKKGGTNKKKGGRK